MTSSGRGEAYEQYERLAEIGILTNYRKLPYGIGHGLRLGTTFSAAAGIDVEHAAELAEIIREGLEGGASERLRERVGTLAKRAAEGAIVPPRYWS
jgi:glycine hydroxymethyltransferase